ncbi:hypothetical protein GHT06_018245 [Daphnia sinensis]|uniref:Uncharacterized protein n=1 Tax=Daphnia sinensis TaxID=1820382 RepID=A0AAD5L3X2_9CRUS|nr:hypothetical protein GHT06_018245 [Daphnia sinensis]
MILFLFKKAWLASLGGDKKKKTNTSGKIVLSLYCWVHNGTWFFESTSIKSRLRYINKVTGLSGRYCLVFFSYHRRCGVYINTTGAILDKFPNLQVTCMRES